MTYLQHHHRDVKELLKACGLKYRYLPRYSPFLNPIEACFGLVGNKLAQGEKMDPSHIFGKNRTQEHLDHLTKTVLECCKTCVTSDKVDGYEKHCMAFFRACLARVPIMSGSHPPSEAELADAEKRMRDLERECNGDKALLQTKMKTAFPPKDKEEKDMFDLLHEASKAVLQGNPKPITTRREKDVRPGTEAWCQQVDLDSLKKYCADHPRSGLAHYIYKLRKIAASVPDGTLQEMHAAMNREVTALTDNIGRDAKGTLVVPPEQLNASADAALVYTLLAHRNATVPSGADDPPAGGAAAAAAATSASAARDGCVRNGGGGAGGGAGATPTHPYFTRNRRNISASASASASSSSSSSPSASSSATRPQQGAQPGRAGGRLNMAPLHRRKAAETVMKEAYTPLQPAVGRTREDVDHWAPLSLQ